VTVAVWVGYDNIKKKETLGRGRTGGNVAVPIFAPIMEAVWREYAPKTPLAPPQEAAAQLIAASGADAASRDTDWNASRRTRKSKSFEIVEYLRKDAKGKAIDKRYALISERSSQSAQRPRPRDLQYGYAATRGYEYERGPDRPWGFFGNQGGWGDSGASGQGMFGQGPSTSGQGGGFWRR